MHFWFALDNNIINSIFVLAISFASASVAILIALLAFKNTVESEKSKIKHNISSSIESSKEITMNMISNYYLFKGALERIRRYNTEKKDYHLFAVEQLQTPIDNLAKNLYRIQTDNFYNISFITLRNKKKKNIERLYFSTLSSYNLTETIHNIIPKGFNRPSLVATDLINGFEVLSYDENKLFNLLSFLNEFEKKNEKHFSKEHLFDLVTFYALGLIMENKVQSEDCVINFNFLLWIDIFHNIPSKSKILKTFKHGWLTEDEKKLVDVDKEVNHLYGPVSNIILRLMYNLIPAINKARKLTIMERQKIKNPKELYFSINKC